MLSVSAIYLLGMLWPGRNSGFLKNTLILLVLISSAAISFVGYSVAPKHGLTAVYYPNELFSNPPALNYEVFGPAGDSRVDPGINFSGRGFSFFEQTFPLYFSNDTSLRVWSPDSDEDTSKYRFSGFWSGKIILEKGVSQIEIEYTGGSVEWFLGGNPVGENILTVGHLPAGEYPLEVRFKRDLDTTPSLKLSWVRDGNKKIVPKGAFLPLEGEGGRHLERFDADWLGLSGLLLWILGNLLVFLVLRPRVRVVSQGGGYWIVFLLLSLFIGIGIESSGREFDANILTVGNDDLTYESTARDHLLGRWSEKNEGGLLFQNLAYPYFLAAMHLIAGEAVVQVIWLQHWLLALSALILAWLVQRLYGLKVAILFLALLLLLVDVFDYSGMLLDTTFGMALGGTLVLLLIQYGRRPSKAIAFWSAVIFAAACLVRANFLPFLVIALGWLLLMSQSRALAVRSALVFLIVFSVGFSVIAVRNYVVADSLKFLPTSGGLNLWVGNHPPEFDGPTYYSVKVPGGGESPGSAAVDYIVEEPLAFLKRVAVKSFYILGINIEKTAVKARVFLLWVLVFVSSFWLIKSRLWKNEYLLIWGWIATVNLPLTIIFPWGYGWRLSAPSYSMLALIVAIAAASYFTKNREHVGS